MNVRFPGAALSAVFTAMLGATTAPMLHAEHSAAFLPFYTNDPELAEFAYAGIAECLRERSVFRLSPRKLADEAVGTLGVDLEQTFGLSDGEFRQVGQHMQTDYVLSGALTVQKSLKFTGWRKDVNANLRLHQASDGAEVGYFLTTTGFSWVSTKTAMDPKAMTQMAVDQFCDEIAEAAANGFKPLADEESDEGSLDF